MCARTCISPERRLERTATKRQWSKIEFRYVSVFSSIFIFQRKIDICSKLFFYSRDISYFKYQKDVYTKKSKTRHCMP